MPHIRQVSDLRNNFADISKIVHETKEPVYLTKNGYGDMVVMSMAAFEEYPIDVHGLRYRRMVVDNYLVFYIVLEDTIEIHRIIYSKMKINNIFK